MRKTARGYTIVELLIVILVICILAVIFFMSYYGIQASSRNSQRQSRIAVIATNMEKYYDQNGEYPICANLIDPNSIDAVVTYTLKGMDPNVLTTPNDVKGSNSLKCDDMTSGPGPDVFSFVANGNKWRLKYREEGSGSIISVDLKRDITTASRKFTLTINTTEGGTVNDGGIYDEGTVRTILAINKTNYIFKNWTGYGCDGDASHEVTITGDMTCTAHFTLISIAAPTAPVVIASTPSDKTNWSWTVSSSCPDDAVFSYQYRYIIDYSGGYTSNWYSTNNVSTVLTTSPEGYEYNIEVQARCSSIYYVSDWSISGTKNYIRPVQNPGPISFDISRYSIDTAQITATSSCTNGAYVWSRSDMAIQYPYVWFDTLQDGFWADSHNGVWKDDNWGHTDPATIRARSLSGSLLTPSSFRMATEIRCQNADTGRYSESTGRQESSWLTLH